MQNSLVTSRKKKKKGKRTKRGKKEGGGGEGRGKVIKGKSEISLVKITT